MMNEMVDVITAVPHGINGVVVVLLSVLLLIQCLHKIIRILQTSEMQRALHGCWIVSRKIGDWLRRAVDDPIKSPNLERVLQYGQIIIS